MTLAAGDYAEANPFRFSTKYYDAETGLSDFGRRYYHAVLGRWLNRDPIGELGGANVYAYVGNNPLNRVDYLGMNACSVNDPWCQGTDRGPDNNAGGPPDDAKPPCAKDPNCGDKEEPWIPVPPGWGPDLGHGWVRGPASNQCFTAAYNSFYDACKKDAQSEYDKNTAIADEHYSTCIDGANRSFAACEATCAQLRRWSRTGASLCMAYCEGTRKIQGAACRYWELNHRARTRGACNLLQINMLWV